MASRSPYLGALCGLWARTFPCPSPVLATGNVQRAPLAEMPFKNVGPATFRKRDMHFPWCALT